MDIFDKMLVDELIKEYETVDVMSEEMVELYERFCLHADIKELEPYILTMRYMGWGTPADKSVLNILENKVDSDLPELKGLYYELKLLEDISNDCFKEALQLEIQNGYESKFIKCRDYKDSLWNSVLDKYFKCDCKQMVVVEESMNNVEAKAALRINSGYLSPAMVWGNVLNYLELERPVILLYDGSINDIRDILPLLEQIVQMECPLFIAASRISEIVLKTLNINMLRNIFRCGAIESSIKEMSLISKFADVQIVDNVNDLREYDAESNRLSDNCVLFVDSTYFMAANDSCCKNSSLLYINTNEVEIYKEKIKSTFKCTADNFKQENIQNLSNLNENEVLIDIGQRVETYVNPVTVVKWHVGPCVNDFFDEGGNAYLKSHEIYVLFIKKSLDKIEEILPILEEIVQNNYSLLIICPQFSEDVKEVLKVNYMRGTIKCCGIEAPDEESVCNLANLLHSSVFETGNELGETKVYELKSIKEVFIWRDCSCFVIGGIDSLQNNRTENNFNGNIMQYINVGGRDLYEQEELYYEISEKMKFGKKIDL